MDLLPKLRDEIADGVLHLRADSLSRCRFSLEIDGELVGCYAVRSTGRLQIRVERAWNARSQSWDPRTGLWRQVILAPKLHKIRRDSKIVLRELRQMNDEVRDEVRLTGASRVELFTGPPVIDGATGATLCFEGIDLLGVRIDG